MKTNVGPNKQHLLQGSPVDWLRIYRICIPVQQHPLPNFVLPFIPQIMIPSKHLALQTCLTVRFWTTQSMTQNPIIPLSFISFLFPSLSFTSFPEQSSPNFSRGSQQGIIYTGWGGAKRNTLAQNKFWRSRGLERHQYGHSGDRDQAVWDGMQQGTSPEWVLQPKESEEVTHGGWY